MFTKNTTRTFAQCAHFVFTSELWEKLWRFKRDRNIKVCRRMGRVKKIVHSENRGQKLWNNVKKSCEIGQDRKTLISGFT